MNLKQALEQNNCDPGITKLFLFAIRNNIRTDFFPEEFLEVLADLGPQIGEYAFDETFFEEFMTKWVELWPSQKVTGLSYPVSGGGPECRKRMRTFISEYKKRFGEKGKFLYICNRVMEATQDYLQEKKVDWSYCKKNVKFIKDNDGSVLEAYMKKDKQNIKMRSI